MALSNYFSKLSAQWDIFSVIYITFQQGKMDLPAHTDLKRMDQKETRRGELLADTVANQV